MPIAAALRKSRWAEILLLGLLSLFFFQLLTAFIAAVYAFGLMGLNIPPEIACVLFLFAPLLLVFARRGPRGGWLAGLGAVMLACRVIEPLLPTRERMLVCGLGTGAGLLAFAGLLAGGEDARPDELSLGQGLALGVGLAALLRAAGGGLDLSTMGMFQVIGWALAVLAASLLLSRVAGGGPVAPSTGQPAGRPGSFWKAAGLSLGLGGGITLLYFAFTAPNVMARWMGASAVLVFALAALALFGFGWLAAAPNRLAWALRPRFLVPANAVFVLALALALRLQQVSFPAVPAGYPVYGPAGLGWQVLLLALAVLLFPVILLDFTLYTREIRCLSLTPRRAGASFSLAALFLLVLIFAQVFTTVYDYIPVVGPFFRDRFWLVFLAAGLGLALPLALVSGRQAAPHFQTAARARFLPSFLAAAGLASTAFAALASLPPAPAPSAETRLRVLTYNIQQGYSADGQKNYLGQLRVMRAANADIIGLQETDTSRIAGGNDDLVGFLAGQLGMHAYYGPDTVSGTFGIALLSRLPIQNPRTYFLYSSGEQTAAISAQVVKGGKTFNVFVTHLGNGGPLVQQQEFLRETAGKENVVAVGDFNFSPRDEPYAETLRSLADAWSLRWTAGVDDQGAGIAEQIDHIFVSPGTRVGEARYLPPGESDHPALLAEIDW